MDSVLTQMAGLSISCVPSSADPNYSDFDQELQQYLDATDQELQQYFDDFEQKMQQYFANLRKPQFRPKKFKGRAYSPPRQQLTQSPRKPRSICPWQRQSSSPRFHRPLSRRNTAPGSIVFAPRHADSLKNMCVRRGCATKNCDFGNYVSELALDHPAVVLALVDTLENDNDDSKDKDNSRTETVALCLMISANPFPKGFKDRCSVPIYREDQTPGVYSSFEEDDIMYLEEVGTMFKQSYIQLNHVIMIPLSQLKQFNGEPFENRLSQESLKALGAKVEMLTEEWEETADLRARLIEE